MDAKSLVEETPEAKQRRIRLERRLFYAERQRQREQRDREEDALFAELERIYEAERIAAGRYPTLEECFICVRNKTKATTTCCAHTLCEPCEANIKWKNHKDAKCPFCRQSFTLNDPYLELISIPK